MGTPKNLNTDLEKAILGKEFQALLREKNIRHYQVNSGEKRTNSVIELFNRTIRQVLAKYFYTRNTRNWLSILPDIIKNYNDTFHTTVHASPRSIWEGEEKNTQERIFLERN